MTYLCSFFFFKQKTAYEMRISDWSSDVCSSDLKGENMLTERRNAANEVAAKLFEAEAAIDHAIVAIGALASAMPQAQAAAKRSTDVGSDAHALLVATGAALFEESGPAVAIHHALDEVTAGLRLSNFARMG